ncbi:hypothetical protein IGI04_006297 [Brassica rapa subsp. trilocularis]|uniref:Uncharacterized protein n=1 Tax=Brassica rapa subsp. trilocularis TaxID=1813537 RepID=A0ABQ7NGW2_BRACM|nr:hypothetical protein IGI04_006297 [Brassica rapa subsp. trilocularis]
MACRGQHRFIQIIFTCYLGKSLVLNGYKVRCLRGLSTYPTSLLSHPPLTAHGNLHSSTGVDERFGKGSTYLDTKLYSAKICHAFRSRNIDIGNGEYALALDISRAPCLAKFYNKIEEDRDSADMFPGL